MRFVRLASLVMLMLLVLAVGAAAAQAPIVFADLNWDSARLQNRVAQYLTEKGYGQATELAEGGTIDLFERLRAAQADVMLELWLPNHLGKWQTASVSGQIFTLGESVTGLAQTAYNIPAYVQEAHPELDSVEDLQDERYASLFVAEDSGGMGILHTCPATWSCNAVNDAQLKGYGLAETIQTVTPESEAALHESLYAAYEQGLPWLGYLDNVMAPSLELELVQLEEPPYSDECWRTTKGCAYESTQALIVISSQLPMRAPQIVAMLSLWEMGVDDYKRMALWRLENQATYEETAIWWLESTPEIWREWVSEAAAESVQAALDAGEILAAWAEDE